MKECRVPNTGLDEGTDFMASVISLLLRIDLAVVRWICDDEEEDDDESFINDRIGASTETSF
jgi:hypothetical protein